MNYTNIEQSKKLLQSGLNPDTADMCWGLDAESGMYNNHPYPMPWKDYTAKSFYIPCWSLTALLDLLPVCSTLDHEKNGWYCSVNFDIVETQNGYKDNTIKEDTALDAVCSMVIWLIENKIL